MLTGTTTLFHLLRLRKSTMANKRVRVLTVTMATIMCVVAGASQAALAVTGAGVAAVAAGLAHCRDSKLAITAAELPGVAVTGGWVIRYRNLSSSTCTLSGYPTVIGLVSGTGPVQAAADTTSGALGGWQPNAPGVQKPLPTVVLSARAGMASSVVEFVTGIGNLLCPSKRYPFWFHSLWLDVPGGTLPFALAVSMIVCSYFDANQIVPGTTGSALQPR